MRNGLKFFGLAALAALSLTALAAQDAVVVKRTAKVGDVAKYRMKAEMDFNGTPASFTGLLTEKVTKIGDNGDYTVEETQSEGKVNVGGNDVPAGAGGTTVTQYHSTGEVVSVTSDAIDVNTYRMARLQSLQFPSTPVKVGDSWKVEVKKDDKGSVNAKGEYKIEAIEKVGDVDAYRIKGSLKESEGDTPAAVDATYWVNVKDGTLLKLNGTWTNMPLPQIGPVTLKVTMVREN